MYVGKKIKSLTEDYKITIEICERYNLSEYKEKLEDKLEDLLSPLKIMIVGEGKSGKSTLLNALVGREVAQVNDEPKTWCINLYIKSDGDEYAELVYPDRIERVSIKEADILSERISNSDSIEDLSDEDISLKEIRWHIDLKWPGKDIYIIDTPGFNQVRKDTGVETIEIDGVEGIKFSAKESFDKYYYKADLVLWCFEATSVGDREVEEHLKAVYLQGKRIYGIVTKLDREEDPEIREKLFQKNDDRYRKYNLAACIRSGLPTIYDDDDDDEIRSKSRIREESVDSIRRCIDYLLNDNKEAEEIKIENSRKYLQEIKKHIESLGNNILKFYYDNYSMSANSVSVLENEIQKTMNNYYTDVLSISENAKYMNKSDHVLTMLWQRSGNDAGEFSGLVSKTLNESEHIKRLGERWEEYCDELENIIRHNLSQIQWKTLTLSVDNPEDEILELENIDLGKEKLQINHDARQFTIDVSQMGLAYQIMNLFEKRSTAYQVINLLAGDVIRERVFSIARESIDKTIYQIYTEYMSSGYNFANRACNNAKELILEKVKKQTGYALDELPNELLFLEENLFLIDACHKEEVIYYVEVHGEDVDFTPSYYRGILHLEPGDLYKNDAVKFCNKYVRKLYDGRLKGIETQIKNTIEKYDGKSAIKRPIPSEKDYTFDQDKELLLLIPPLDKIDWRGIYDSICNEYKNCKDDYLARADKIWENEANKKRQLLIIKQKGIIANDLKAELKRFTDAWKVQMESDITAYLTNRRWRELPENTDYYRYYVTIYPKHYPQDKMIGYVRQYEESGKIPDDEYIEKYMVKDVYGKPLKEEIQNILRREFNSILDEIRRTRSECLKSWDYYFHNYEEYLSKICDRYFTGLDSFMRKYVKMDWDKYKLSGDTSCANIMEFAIKNGKLTKPIKEFLFGNVAESKQFTGITMSDGSKLSDFCKTYIKEKLPEYIILWG